MIAKCREWGVDIPIWEMEDADGFKVVLRRPTFGGSAFPGPSGRKGRGNTQVTAQVGDQVTQQVTQQVRRLLQAIGDVEVGRVMLMNAVGLKDRVGFKYSYLDPALESGLIEMTQPNSPQSPTQKYRLTAKGRALAAQLAKKGQTHG